MQDLGCTLHDLSWQQCSDSLELWFLAQELCHAGLVALWQVEP